MVVPNFIIAGERRSGTTSLAKWIEAHPEIFLHPSIDMGYFIEKELVGRRNWINGILDKKQWEKDHSKDEYISFFREGAGRYAIGEKSADYFFWRPAHKRIHDYFPNIKLIISIRNPIERAWSMYWNEVGKGREDLSFEEAIKKEKIRIEASDYAKDHLSYITRGKYDESLNDLFKVFKREQVLVLVLEDSMKDPVKTLKKVYSFLGISTELGLDLASNLYNNNWTSKPKKIWTKNIVLSKIELVINKLIQVIIRILFRDIYKRRKWKVRLEGIFRNTKKDFKMNPNTRQELYELFLPHIRNTEKILGRDLSIWK